MATIPQLSLEEQQHLVELLDILQTANTPGWQRIMQRLDELVEEAHEAMVGAGDAPDVVLAAKTRRWAQREAMVRDIRDFVASCETERKVILESAKETVNAEN